MLFYDRRAAGQQLAKKLERYRNTEAIVLGLPRGGIILAKEAAKYLHVPLGLILVKKIGHPVYSEYAIGAIAENIRPVYNQFDVNDINPQWLSMAEENARQLILQRRRLYYDDDFHPPKLSGKIAIIVDDGIATGLTMKVAVLSAKQSQAKKVIVASAVASQTSLHLFNNLVDDIVLLDDPSNFGDAVGAHYRNFQQVSDEEVIQILRQA